MQAELVGSMAVYLTETTSQHLPPSPRMVKGAHDGSAELQSLGEVEGLDFWLNVVGWTSVFMDAPSPNPPKWQ